MKPLPHADTETPRAPIWKPIATPVVATLAIGAVALTAFAFVTIFLLLAGFVLAAFVLWRVSGVFQRRRAPGEADITGPRPYNIHMRSTTRDRHEFDAFLDERARVRPRD